MIPLRALLLMIALVCFLVSALVPPYWNRLVSAGLAAWVASILF